MLRRLTRIIGFVLKVVYAPVAFMGLIVFVLPIAYFKVRHPMRPNYHPIEEPQLPNDVWMYFERVAERLAHEGFETRSHLITEDPTQLERYYLRTFFNAHTGDSATAVYVGAPVDGGVIKQYVFVEFLAVLADGRVLEVNNSRIDYPFPAPSYKFRLQIPWIENTRQLFRIYRALLESQHAQQRAELSRNYASEPMEVLCDQYENEVVDYVGAGYLHLLSEEYQCKLSWKGATVGVLRTMWPAVMAYRRYNRFMIQRLLRRYDIDPARVLAAIDEQVLAQQSVSAPLAAVSSVLEQALRLARTVDAMAVPIRAEFALEETAQDLTILRATVGFVSIRYVSDRKIRSTRRFNVDYARGLPHLRAITLERQLSPLNLEDWSSRFSAATPVLRLPDRHVLKELHAILPAVRVALLLKTSAGQARLHKAELLIHDGKPVWRVSARNESQEWQVSLHALTGQFLAAGQMTSVAAAHTAVAEDLVA